MGPAEVMGWTGGACRDDGVKSGRVGPAEVMWMGGACRQWWGPKVTGGDAKELGISKVTGRAELNCKDL